MATTRAPRSRSTRVASATSTAVLAALAAVGAVAAHPTASHADGQAARPSAAPAAPSGQTRGIVVRHTRLGIDASLQLLPPGRAAQPLHDGDTVHSGDEIRASVVTSADAEIYVAFCTRHQLAMFPAQHGVHATPGQERAVPADGDQLFVDDQPGIEVLYLIVSRRELSLADPALAAEIAKIGADPAADCSERLDQAIAPHPQPGPAVRAAGATTVLRGEIVRKQPMPPPGPSVDPKAAAHTGPSPAGFERGPGDIVWYRGAGAPAASVVAAGPDDIAVVRYRFVHAGRKPPH